MKYLKSILMVGLLFAGSANASIAVHNSDFINDNLRTNFNGFESMPVGTFIHANGPYIENGISVNQVNGDPYDDIWVTYSPPGKEGMYLWYPNGGDRGYTVIKREDGSNFFDVGMLIGSGASTTQAYYELLENGSLVMSGAVDNQTALRYLGFSGGGFDEIRLRNYSPFGSGGLNALSLDSIELTGGSVSAVPEPASLALVAGGLLGIGAVRRRSRCA